MTEEEMMLALATAEGFGKGLAEGGIDKVSKIASWLFPFVGMKKRGIDSYINTIESSDDTPEEKWLKTIEVKKKYKFLKNQSKITKIAISNAEEGTDFSESSEVDDEWLERFMDSAKFVSDDGMQAMWGRVLAGEFEKPNSTPPSITRILTEIRPKYAEAFQKICSMSVVFVIETDEKSEIESYPLLFNDMEYLKKVDVNFDTLNELRTLGLIQYEVVSNFILKFEQENINRIHIVYNDNYATVSEYPDEAFPIGAVLLTEAGKRIVKCIQKDNIDSYFDYMKENLEEHDVKFMDFPKIDKTKFENIVYQLKV